jgi:hypothetical protein
MHLIPPKGGYHAPASALRAVESFRRFNLAQPRALPHQYDTRFFWFTRRNVIPAWPERGLNNNNNFGVLEREQKAESTTDVPVLRNDRPQKPTPRLELTQEQLPFTSDHHHLHVFGRAVALDSLSAAPGIEQCSKRTALGIVRHLERCFQNPVVSGAPVTGAARYCGIYY